MEIEIKKLEYSDLKRVSAFYNRQIAGLENKNFFYPYTALDLDGILKPDGGHMLGGFIGGELVAVAAIDFDVEYGNGLKRELNITSSHLAYELSGVMVDKEYRGMGISSKLIARLVEFAKKELLPCIIIGVVEERNEPSQRLFLKNGFKAFGEVKQDLVGASTPHIGFVLQM